MNEQATAGTLVVVGLSVALDPVWNEQRRHLGEASNSPDAVPPAPRQSEVSL